MKMRIAVISTSYLNSYIEAALTPFKEQCDIDFFVIDNYRECVDLFAALQKRCDGFWVSDLLIQRLIAVYFPHNKKPVFCYNIDYTGYYRVIMLLLVENRAFELDRLFIDFVDYISPGLMSNFIRSEMLVSLYDRHIDWLLHASPNDINAYYAQCIERIEQAYDDHRIDLVITSQYTLASALEKRLIPYQFAYPNERTVREGMGKLLEHLEVYESQKSWPAIIHISYRLAPSAFDDRKVDKTLKDTIMLFAHRHRYDFVATEQLRHLEVVTNISTVNSITRDHTCCELSLFLEKSLIDSVNIGYGFGRNIPTARYAASCAHHESALAPSGGSFVINLSEQIIGPLRSPNSTAEHAVDEVFICEKSQQTGLSQSTIRRICEYIAATGSNKTTAQGLASGQGTSLRTANRILSKLKKVGEAIHIPHENLPQRGRPEYWYLLFPNDEITTFIAK